MQLQPSTQSWRVICVRAGIALSWSSVNSAGPRDEAADHELVAAKPASRSAT
jgi:hypothetical protein